MPNETDWIGRTAIDFLIDDARQNFKGERQKTFVWAIFNALRKTDAAESQNLRELVRKYTTN